MHLLLDTHVLLWAASNDKRLKQEIRDVLNDDKNVLTCSIVSLWEIAIKKSINKLKAPSDFAQLIQDAGYEILPVKVHHIRQLQRLDLIHKDPFDRMLIAQAKEDALTLITADSDIQKYDVAVLAA